MILPSTCNVLHNIQNSFYYNGIEISKKNFDITEFALVCSKINDLKEQIQQEKFIHNLSTKSIISEIVIDRNDKTSLLCKYNNAEYYFGLYNNRKKEIIPLTKELFNNISDNKIYLLSNELNITAKLVLKNVISETKIKDKMKIISFDNYISNIKNLSNSFQYTYELEFINGYKEYLLTNEELKNAIIER